MSATVDFRKDVIEASALKPVLVDFWAPWCGPCRTLGPVLEKVAADSGDRFILVKVNTDEHQDVAQAYRVASIPAVFLFSQGKPVAQFVGALPEPMVRQWLDQHIPSQTAKDLGHARQALRAGERGKAQQIFESILRTDPGNDEARVGLAHAVFFDDTKRALELLARLSPHHPHAALADSMRTLARLMSLDLETLRDGASPADYGHYVDGVRALREGRLDDALDLWLAVMRRNRKLDDDGARKAVLALLNLLGEGDARVPRYRRDLASALY